MGGGVVMTRLHLVLLLPLLCAWPSVNMGGGVAAVGGGGGQAFVDTFTRTNTAINTGCTGGDTCEWQEFCTGGGDCLSTTGTTLDVTAGVTWRAVTDSDADADTAAQYVAAQATGTVSGSTNSGITLRDQGLSTGGGFYVLRYNGNSDFILRSCNAIATCTDADIATVSGINFGGIPITGDSYGMSVDSATGDSVEFTLYRWDAAAPDADFADWATGATSIWTVCASGCDQGFTTQAPSETAAGAQDSGRSGGIYDGNTGGLATWDNWMFGDVP